VGRTDALGRLVFVPDRPGLWRVRVFSEDGHGADFTVETGPMGQVVTAERSLFDRYLRLIVGVAVILGLFGALRLYVSKSARRPVGEGK
jgi:nickel transport protein